ncbi:FAD:protein FMN transferase [Alteraurantiacibacter aquimixticola]|uniref:FAD:protein FMN transferase n=1 Tax=Alteraurantiacibacter aquimixticola TaxID=2489173 RepID=UPI00145A06E8|nr:FAD:protein FMN transferase [Alteraurantiacibacter aquimixticola]
MLFLPPVLAPVDRLPSGEEIGFGGRIFGTTWSVRMVMRDDASALELFVLRGQLQRACEVILALVDQQMSPWIADSDLNRYNGLPDGGALALREPMRALVGDALVLWQQTGGLFDPFIGEATDLWGFGPVAVGDGLPDAGALSAIRSLRHGDRPCLQGDELIRKAGFQLDLCGIAKGFAVDLLMDRLQAEPGVASVLVEIGGELKGCGVKPDAMPWWVDLDWAEDAGEPRMRLALHDWACASSGVAQRSFVHGERRYSHAIDPATGEPTTSDLAGVTVLAPECWRADALATALLVAGQEGALALANRLAVPCLLIPSESGERPVCSAAMQDWLVDD